MPTIAISPSNYGWHVNRVRSLFPPARSKPVWSFVEIGCPWSGTGRASRIEQIKRRYLALLYRGGAGRDLLRPFLQGRRRERHLWFHVGHAARLSRRAGGAHCAQRGDPGGGFGLQCPVAISPGSPQTAIFKALAKWDGPNFYVFAGATRRAQGPVSGSFSIPCVGNATATVSTRAARSRSTAGPSPTPLPTATPSTSTASTAALTCGL